MTQMMTTNTLENGYSLLNVTWKGQNGDFTDPVMFDASDADVKRWAAEAIQTGGIPGIDADQSADLTDFVVDRFAAKDGLPARLSLRPKTPFGTDLENF